MTVRKGQFLLTTATPMDGFEGVVYYVEQPSELFWFKEGAQVEEATGNVRIKIVKGEIMGSNEMISIGKGRVVVELSEVSSDPIAKFGFSLWAKSGNYSIRFHLEDDKYYFRTGGTGFGGDASLRLTQEEFIRENEIYKIETVIEDDPNNSGKLAISIIVNDRLYQKKSNMPDIIEDGETLRFCFDCLGETPETECYCIVKSITFYPAE